MLVAIDLISFLLGFDILMLIYMRYLFYFHVVRLNFST